MEIRSIASGFDDRMGGGENSIGLWIVKNLLFRPGNGETGAKNGPIEELSQKKGVKR